MQITEGTCLGRVVRPGLLRQKPRAQDVMVSQAVTLLRAGERGFQVEVPAGASP